MAGTLVENAPVSNNPFHGGMPPPANGGTFENFPLEIPFQIFVAAFCGGITCLL